MKPVSHLHAAARQYASQGWPVFPTGPDDPSISDPVLRNKIAKRPACENGFHDATTDLSIIDKWWTDNPRLNVAFCPHMVGLAIIDPDGSEGLNNWEQWQAANVRMPQTWTVATPRGGVHEYYRGILPPSQSKLAEHVDTRGVGSYALLPPSLVCGNPYVVTDETPAAELPAEVGAFLDQLRKERVKAAVTDLDTPQALARASRLLRDYVARGHVAVEGQMGDARTFVTACEVMNLGVSEETAADLIADLWNPHCVPPWDDDELKIKVENAARYAQNDAGAWGTESSEDTFGSALDKLAPTLASPSPELKRRPFRPWTVEELASRPPPVQLLPDLMPNFGLSLLYGPPGSWKTWLALDWSCTLAALGTAVAYVAGEGASDIPRRVEAWKLAHGIEGPIPLFVMEQAPWASDDGQLIEFVKELREVRPALVVIDTFARSAVSLNENDARDMGTFVAAMDGVWRGTGAAVLVIHHTGKDEGRGARGSNALFGAVECAVEASLDERTKIMRVRVVRQKSCREREAPWLYEGKDVGAAMVLQELSAVEFKRRMSISDATAPKAIGALLRELGAQGYDRGLSTHVLALELVGRAHPDLSDDDRSVMVANQARILGQRAEGPLEAYCAGKGNTRLWFVP